MQVGDAMRRMQERNNIGKVILITEPMKEEEKKIGRASCRERV